MDDLYPNDGEVYILQQPFEIEKEIKDEEAQALKSEPLLKKTMDHLSNRIAHYKSIDAIPEDTLANPEEFMHVVAAQKVVVSILESEKELLRQLLPDKKR